MFWSRNRAVIAKIQNYLNVVRECLDCCYQGIKHLTKHGYDARFARYVDEAHQKESDADEIRRAVEMELYEKSLLPDAREDILLLLERLDAIPNRAEDILRELDIVRIDLPQSVAGGIREMVRLARQTFDLVAEAVEDAFGRAERLSDLARRIDEAESVVDKLQLRMRRELFRSDFDMGTKILLSNLILAVGDLCDTEEDAAYFLRIFVIKRRM